MSRRRFLLLVAAAAVALALALLLTSRHHLTHDTQGGLLLPQLGTDLNAVTAVTIRKGGDKPAVSLRRSGASWTVTELGDYPADLPKLRRLLLALSEARRIEEKTSNPASYAAIGVEDPAKPGAFGSEISVLGPHGTTALVVGKPSGNGNFVRLSADAASYLAEPGISFETEPRYWIDARLVDIPLASIQTLSLQPSDGPGYTLHRVGSEGDGFALDSVPAGRSALDAKSLAPSPSAFGNLAADDVASAGSIDFSKPATLVLTLSDGDKMTLTGASVGEKRWISIASANNAALDAKAKGRAYLIARYRYEAIFRPLDSLLQPKAAAATKLGAAVKPASLKSGRTPLPAASPLPTAKPAQSAVPAPDASPAH
jgi:hypothetical protein